ncbi:MAG: (Fe-S)-binding protein [Deltaproteobacteria bacterium]|nr:(Fe-S)-binding protein [Candidatus Zymogenaceae bacterium]
MDTEQIKETIQSCKHCFMCRHACPTFLATKLDSHTPRGYALLRAEIDAKKLSWTKAIVDRFYQCSQCGLCREDCAYHWREDELVRQAREEIIQANAVPDRVKEAADELISRDEAGAENIKNLSIQKDVVGKKHPDILFLTGAAARIETTEVLESAAVLMTAAGSDWGILEREPSAIAGLFELGYVEQARAEAKRLIDAVTTVAPKRIVIGCAHQYRAMTDYLPRMGVSMPEKIEIRHFTEYLDRAITAGDLNVKKVDDTSLVGYHDPCHLGRNAGILDAPRRVIEAATGAPPIELFHSKKMAECCGAGAGMFLTDPDIAELVAAHRLSGAISDGVETLITACPNCTVSFRRAAKAKDLTITVTDIGAFLAERI